MAKFVFKFDGVLRQREHVETQRQRELAIVQQEMTGLQIELRALNDSVRASTADLRDNHLTGPLDLNFLAAHRRFTLAMARKGTALVQQIATVQKRLEIAQAALAEAAKQRKIIEKLRERSLQRWKDTLARNEMIETDETAMQIGYRNRLDEADRVARDDAQRANSAEASA
ncbi:MAG TPA: flagellar export protein FliJ [Tepidisphaeraceae bacterium]|nr:flagellar export protein FliJ [Tepidisphaeraceae bacterium]